jgi:hypothetical protein
VVRGQVIVFVFVFVFVIVIVIWRNIKKRTVNLEDFKLFFQMSLTLTLTLAAKKENGLA